MQIIIGAKLLSSKEAQPREKPFELRDSRLRGFVLRVQPSGVRSYYASWSIGQQRSQRVSLGKVGVLTPEEARERCSQVLGNVAHGRPPLYGIDGAETAATGPTLKEFIDGTYAPWVKANRPRYAQWTLDRLEHLFSSWYGRPLSSLTVEDIENWRIERLKAGKRPTTTTRDLHVLASVLTRAMKMKKLRENVVRQVEKPRIDRNPHVRFLSADEEARMRAKLAEPYPYDSRRVHLAPAVLISLNTGVRRGELFALLWADVLMTGDNPCLTVRGGDAKDAQTRHIPLNAEAIAVLKAWHAKNPDTTRVFEFDTNLRSSWLTLLERAKITRFRWHDLRHHFASRLVQKGVPLNTVRDLMGHSDIKMTLRYAHLAPDQRKQAVALLMEARTG